MWQWARKKCEKGTPFSVRLYYCVSGDTIIITRNLVPRGWHSVCARTNRQNVLHDTSPLHGAIRRANTCTPTVHAQHKPTNRLCNYIFVPKLKSFAVLSLRLADGCLMSLVNYTRYECLSHHFVESECAEFHSGNDIFHSIFAPARRHCRHCCCTTMEDESYRWYLHTSEHIACQEGSRCFGGQSFQFRLCNCDNFFKLFRGKNYITAIIITC